MNMRGMIAGGVAAAASVFVISAGRCAEPVCAPESLRPVLASPRWEADDFYFRLDGASNATYLIEVSTNLNDWTVFSTNGGGTWIGLQPTHQQAYVRAVLEDPVYPLFNFAVRTEGVDLIANDVDSYDSSNPLFSTNGRYDPTKTKDGADLALGAGYEGENSLGNSKIKGRILTVTNAVVTLGPNAQIGSIAWHMSASIGIEPGWLTENLRTTFMPKPVSAPFTSGMAPAPGLVGGVSYSYVLASGDYVIDRLAGQVFVAGNARLLVWSSIRAERILISSNASLQIFCAAPDASLQDVLNLAEISSFQFYGLASNISVTFSTEPMSSSGLVLKGLIYAPNATCVIPGGGGDRPQMYGACVVQYLRAHYLTVHFDEHLKLLCIP